MNMGRLTSFGLLLVTSGYAGACARQGPEAAPPPLTEAAAQRFEEDSGGLTPSLAELRGAPDAALAAEKVVDAGIPSSPIALPSPANLPKVRVVTIGMHVGGGPYDEVTKEPIKRSVEPRLGELAACWRLVGAQRQADAGVDLLIDANGGKARVSNSRATIDGEGFKPCVVAFFESIDFQKPKTGRSTVSYSVRFMP